MKKTYRIEDLDCAHCAQKMEEAIGKLEGVLFVRINFLSERLTLEVEEGRLDAIMKEVDRICRDIEPDCRIVL